LGALEEERLEEQEEELAEYEAAVLEVEDDEPREAAGGGAPAVKKSRTVRKLTARIFFDQEEDGRFSCCLGCSAKGGQDRFSLASGSTTTSLQRHMEAKHPSWFERFRAARNNKQNLRQLEVDIRAENRRALETLARKDGSVARFLRKLEKGLEHKVYLSHPLCTLILVRSNATSSFSSGQ
jgi:hypothetical protein